MSEIISYFISKNDSNLVIVRNFGTIIISYFISKNDSNMDGVQPFNFNIISYFTSKNDSNDWREEYNEKTII